MVNSLEFKEKQFDGPYEVAQIELENKGEFFKGLLYFPSETFHRPYPLVIYFHGFPQLFPLPEIVKAYKYILDMGYAFCIFNFRGYRYSEGQISIDGQLSDAMKIIEFVKKLAQDYIFDLNHINILAHDFGSFISILLGAKVKGINKLLLLNPILNLKRLVYSDNFIEVLEYINRFLPGNIRGVEDTDKFIHFTKKELSKKKFNIRRAIKDLKVKEIKTISGEKDKISPIKEIKNILKNSNINPQITVIPDMDHQCIDEDEEEQINKEIMNFFILNLNGY